MKWFTSNISTMEELRREYRRLAKLHHPDAGGDTENMKEINSEFDTLSLILSRQEATQEKKEPPEYRRGKRSLQGRYIASGKRQR